MASGRALTGGTGDVNPQPLRCRVVAAAGTAAATGGSGLATVAIPIPVQRLSTGGRAQVMEILKVTADVGVSVGNPAGLTGWEYIVTLSSRSNAATSPPAFGNADPYSIIYYQKQIPAASINPGIGNNGVLRDMFSVDLTDGAAHGILFGQDTIFLQLYNALYATGNTFTGSCDLVIWYRWKNVGFTEYVGMVTSN